MNIWTKFASLIGKSPKTEIDWDRRRQDINWATACTLAHYVSYHEETEWHVRANVARAWDSCYGYEVYP